MKFKEHSSSAVKVGDIKSNEVSIDVNNLDFIITILSSGLYSKPIESFVREIVSNAWDSHIEAKNTKEPIVLELGETTEGQRYCKIQDFGVGLSPERFNKIYKNIGSSTKRGSNDEIGGFGIGRFSALSYSNVVKITSCHDGVEYLYLMCKENNKLSIDLLHSKPSSNKNGVSVEINIDNYDTQKFVNAIKSQLAYFNNLVVIESIPDKPYNIENKFNNFKIKDYKNFCCHTLVTDLPTSPSILLGKVNYPLRFSALKKRYTSQVMNQYPIAIKLNIGDVGITPNREELLYTDESIEKIQNALDASILEIKDLFKEQNNKDYQNFNEFCKALDDEDRLTLIEDDFNKINIFNPVQENSKEKTFKGKQYNCLEFKTYINVFKKYRYNKGYYYLNNNKSIVYRNYGLNLENTVNNNLPLYITDMSKLSTHAKAYIRETFPNESRFIKSLNSISVTKMLIKAIKSKYSYNRKIAKIVLQYYYLEYAKIPKFSNLDVPKKFIDDRKAAARAKRKNVNREENYWKQNVNLELIKDYGPKETNNYKLLTVNTKFKALTVYSYKGDQRLDKLTSLFPKVNFVGIAPTKTKLLKPLSNFVNLENFMDKKYKAIRNLGTIIYLQKQIPNLNALYQNELLPLISTRLYKVVNQLCTFCNNNFNTYAHSALSDEIYDYCLENNAFNEEILSLCNTNKKELNNLKILILLDESISSRYNESHKKLNLVNFVVDYVLARKLIRPDIEAVRKLKKETIFNNK